MQTVAAPRVRRISSAVLAQRRSICRSLPMVSESRYIADSSRFRASSFWEDWDSLRSVRQAEAGVRPRSLSTAFWSGSGWAWGARYAERTLMHITDSVFPTQEERRCYQTVSIRVS